MDERYWDQLASTYVEEVHDNLASDRHGVIAHRLDEFASRRKIAVDFGCGIGHYLAALSSRFRIVHALDHSAALLKQARARHTALSNVIYRKTKLSRALDHWKPADFGVCMNVLIAPDHALRTAMVETMHHALLPGARLLVVLPSLESAIFVDQRLVDWTMRGGMTHDRAVREGLRGEPGIVGHVVAGVVACGGEPTKHYLAEEAVLMMNDGGFDVLDIEKVEHEWAEEFDHPPRWMREPYPWHWLPVCERKA